MSTQKKPVPWQKLIAPYAKADWRKAWMQVLNTIPVYLILWTLTIWAANKTWWLGVLLAIPTAGFMIRTFIIFHDAGHGSFFPSRKANDIIGFITGVLTWTPSHRWWHDHAIHHATAGDLDRRGVGDVKTLTVEEYLALPWERKLFYRLFRAPIFMFTIGSFSVFAFVHRIPFPHNGRREKASVWWTNLALLFWCAFWIALFGWRAFLITQVCVLAFGTSAGVWLFYVQHNFDGTYWTRHENWSFFDAAMKGSSYYKLPPILQWITGNIGFHHIHHLSPKVPNYNLARCHAEVPEFQVEPLTIRKSLRSLRYRLWDERARKMVGWEAIKRYKLQNSPT
ncbi:MAG: fatty acid desaturase [Anaerolineae bacterium]|nr:MAG: fatty acid desaturase [Anaerolineae bacterium]